MNNNYINLIGEPKISIIVPLYNCEKTITSSIHSIQYQNMSQIEIILINDFSEDNTSYIIEKIQKDDHRIKIINNQKNRGTLYSRCIGVLVSKGNYIFNLDNDDLYFCEDLFDNIYHIANNETLDIINFLTINVNNYALKISQMKNLFSVVYPNEFYLKQPDLGKWMIKYKERYVVHHNMIWDKCINSNIYKKAIYLMGFKKYSQYVSWAEDTSINYIIFKISKSFKYIKKYGIIHFKGKNTASNTQSLDSKIFGEIFFLDILFNFSNNNNEEKNLIIGQIFYIYKRYKYFKFNNDINSNLLKHILNKIINCGFLNKNNRRKIKKIFYSFFI
jgi:glycosyltransferase involved in cell wall biosynthesis